MSRPQLMITPRSIRTLLAVAAATAAIAHPGALFAQTRAASTGGNSAHETTSTVIGERRTGCRVTITYGRPTIANPKTGEVRKIWGGLVPWEKAWRLGSDEATLLLTQKPLVFGDTTIPAGAHTLYLVPSENGTTLLAFSSNLGKWGVPVDESTDIARVPLKKEMLAESVDPLTISVVYDKDKDPSGGVLRIAWETTQFSAPFTVGK
jgi:hypothetical protein